MICLHNLVSVLIWQSINYPKFLQGTVITFWFSGNVRSLALLLHCSFHFKKSGYVIQFSPCWTKSIIRTVWRLGPQALFSDSPEGSPSELWTLGGRWRVWALWVLQPQAQWRSSEAVSSVVDLASQFWKKSANSTHTHLFYSPPSPKAWRGRAWWQFCRAEGPVCPWGGWDCGSWNMSACHDPFQSPEDACPLWAQCKKKLVPPFLLPAPQQKIPKDLDASYTPPGWACSPGSAALRGRLTPFHVKCAEYPPLGFACANQIRMSLQSFTWARVPEGGKAGLVFSSGGGIWILQSAWGGGWAVAARGAAPAQPPGAV